MPTGCLWGNNWWTHNVTYIWFLYFKMIKSLSDSFCPVRQRWANLRQKTAICSSAGLISSLLQTVHSPSGLSCRQKWHCLLTIKLGQAYLPRIHYPFMTRKLNLLLVVDFRLISAFLHALWVVNSHARQFWNFFPLSFPEFDINVFQET